MGNKTQLSHGLGGLSERRQILEACIELLAGQAGTRGGAGE